MSLKGNVGSLKDFAKKLRDVPVVVAQRVASASAPAITEAAHTTFDAGQDPYGVPWAPGADGQAVTLERTGLLKRTIRYVAIGTKLRVALGVPYAKYQIGKRPVFPRQGAPLPVAYTAALSEATSKEIREVLS